MKQKVVRKLSVLLETRGWRLTIWKSKKQAPTPDLLPGDSLYTDDADNRAHYVVPISRLIDRAISVKVQKNGG